MQTLLSWLFVQKTLSKNKTKKIDLKIQLISTNYLQYKRRLILTAQSSPSPVCTDTKWLNVTLNKSTVSFPDPNVRESINVSCAMTMLLPPPIWMKFPILEFPM